MTTKKSLPLSDEELEAYETTRDLYAELKQAAKDIEAGLFTVVHSPVIAGALLSIKARNEEAAQK